jgi:hypothetical protein
VAERFISLAAFVRGHDAAARAEEPAVGVVSAPVAPAGAVAADGALGAIDFPHAEILNELTLLRVAAFEALERVKVRWLERFAADVSARELALAPVDLQALAERVVLESGDLEPVALIVNALDAESIRAPFPIRIDPSLGPGDLIVEVRDGALESRFSFRAQAALEYARRSA